MVKINIINTSPAGRRYFAKDVTLENIPENCKVYCLVFGVSDADQSIKKYLEDMGKEYANNLFVGFWSMADERYSDVATFFDLKNLPAIVITAESSLSNIEGSNESALVRLDNPRLLLDIDILKQTIRLLYNLFVRGEVSNVMSIANKKNREATIKDIRNKIKNIFTDTITEIIEKYNIDISYGQFKIRFEKN